MDLALQAAAVRGMGFLLASAGFMLSLLAVVLNPFIQVSEPQQTTMAQRYSLQSSSRDRSTQRGSLLSANTNPSDMTISSTYSDQSPVSTIPRNASPDSAPLPPTPTRRRLEDVPLPPSYPSTSATTTEMHDAIFTPPPSVASSGDPAESHNHRRLSRGTSHHSFHLPHLPRHWKEKRVQPSRAFSMPSPTVSRKPSVAPDSSSQKSEHCPMRAVRRSLRKSTSAPAGELPQMKMARAPKSPRHALSPVNEKPSPPARTNPYDAPYFFPVPGSPESVDYIRQARADRLRHAVSSDQVIHTPRPVEARVDVIRGEEPFALSPPPHKSKFSKRRRRRPSTMDGDP